MTEEQRYELRQKIEEACEAAALGDADAACELTEEALDYAAETAGGMEVL